MPKPRSDSLFAQLTPEQRETLCRWLCLEGMGYKECAAKVVQEFGIDCSVGALHNFYSRHTWEWRVKEAKANAEAMGESLPADVDTKIRTALKQAQWEKSLQQLSLPELLELAGMQTKADELEIKRQALEIQRKRVELLEKKLAESQAVATDSSLTPEQKAQKMREILGMA